MQLLHTMHKGVMALHNSKGWIERLAEQADLQDAVFPGQPIVEVYGDRRVLIEHHTGVTKYGKDEICLRMKFGCLHIRGRDLEIAKMTNRQLVVTGQIDGMEIVRRR